MGQSHFDDTFRHVGTSYKYNTIPWEWIALRWQTWEPPEDAAKGLTEKPVSWVPYPSRFILLNEWPALPWAVTLEPTWAIWHFSRSPKSLHSTNDIRQKVVSPILFIDSHVAVHDFTKTVKSEFPADFGPDWVWYKPLPKRR